MEAGFVAGEAEKSRPPFPQRRESERVSVCAANLAKAVPV